MYQKLFRASHASCQLLVGLFALKLYTEFLKFWRELQGIYRSLFFSFFYCWLWHFSV